MISKNKMSKEFKQEVKKLQKIYFVIFALSETLKDKAEKIEQQILNENFFTDEEGNRITNHNNSYMICEKQLDKFYELRKQSLRADGLGHPKDAKGISVDAVASHNVVKMKHRIFDFVIKNLPSNISKSLETGKFKIINGNSVFDQVIDMFLKLKV